MLNRRVIVCAVLCACHALHAQQPASPTPGKRLIGYYTSWSVYDRGFEVADVRGDRLTHLNYAFATIAAGKCVSADPWADNQRPTKTSPSVRGNFQALKRLKQRRPHLKTMISIGGWTLSGSFSDTALTANTRKQFASSCLEFIQRHGFDGVDIDWEYPVSGGKPGNRSRPVDKRNYTRLLAEVRRQFDAREKETGQDLLLTIAIGARPELMANLEVSAIAKHVDWINVMTYDYQGAWSHYTGFHSPLHHSGKAPRTVDTRLNTAAAVQALLEAGLPRDQLVLGIPFYGRGWKQASPTQHGLFQKHRGAMKSRHEPGLIPYRELLKKPGFGRHWDAQAKSSWFYNAATRDVVVCNDKDAVAAKADYVKQHQLGGAMVWELGHDAEGEQSLLETLWQRFNSKR